MKYYLHCLKNYANFKGRARRKEYWMFFLFNLLAAVLLGFIEGASGMNDGTETSVLGTIYQVLVLLPSLAVAVRRMHDVNKSGWYILIPIYNLILALSKGDEGSNAYGPDPKNPESDITDHLIA